MPLRSFEQPQPRFNPPMRNWREDMPESSEPQLVPPQLHQLTMQNNTYLELPRYSTEVVWWMMRPWAVVAIILMIFMVSLCLAMQISSGIFYFPLTLLALISVSIFSSLAYLGLKMYYCEPRDQPIRFNRKRNKIYIFDYRRFYNPWRKWPVTITSYNWEEVHGEVCYAATRVDSGYQLYGTVCTPGTNNVIARFLIAKQSGDRAELSQLWSYLCQYMKGENLHLNPRTPGRPSDWCPRKADKWPTEMEWESTTAPGSTITHQ